jgi:hypothetical protein
VVKINKQSVVKFIKSIVCRSRVSNMIITDNGSQFTSSTFQGYCEVTSTAGQMSKWFYDTSTGAATRAARCGSFIGGVVVSWSLAMDERGGHEDLRGSSRRSVIPYVHERTELYCSSLPCLSLPFFFPMKRCLSDPFIAQGRVVTMRPGPRQMARDG